MILKANSIRKCCHMMTSPIVRTACRTGQTAVASIPRHLLSGLRVPVCRFAVCASHGTHEACETASESRASLLREARLRLSTSRSVERLYYTWRGMSRKNASMDDTPCPDLTQVRTNVDYTSHSHSREAIKVSPSAHPALFVYSSNRAMKP